MNTLLKVVLGIVAVVVVGLVAVAIAVALLFEPNDYRPLLVDAVERNTGRSFEIQGDLGLSLFPCCSVEVGPSTLGNPAGFPDEHFARLDQAALSLKIWPLLVRREIHIGTVSVDGMDLALVRTADGRVNWEFAEPDATRPDDEPANGALDGVSIAGLRVSDARISYRDLESGQAFTASPLQLRTGAIAVDAPFPFETRVTVTDNTDGTSAELDLAGTLTIGDDRVLLGNPRLEVVASGPAVPARRASARIAATALDLGFGELAELVADGVTLSFEITDPGEIAAEVSGRGNLARLQLNLETFSGSVSDLAIEIQGLDARARLAASGGFGAPDAVMNGSFNIDQATPRRLLAAMGDAGYRPARGDALNRLSGSGRWALDGQQLNVEDLNVILDDSRLTGSLALEDFDAGAVRFDLRLDQIDLDRYQPAAETASAAAAAEPAAATPTTIPLGDLAEVTAQGQLHIGRLRAAGAELTDLQLRLASRNGMASVGLQGQGFGGSFEVSGDGNVAAAEPTLSGLLTLRDVSPRALLAAVDEPPQTTDPDVLANLSGTANWRLGVASVALEDMRWQLDQTRLTGSLRVDDLDRLATRFDLALDQLNLDRYLAPEQADAAEQPPTEIPVEAIRDLQIDGRLVAQELTLMAVPLRSVVVEVRGADGVLRLDPLRARLYGGEYRGAITVDATGPQAALAVTQELSAVQIGELLRNFFDTDRIAGSLSLALSGNGAGATLTDLLADLAGSFSMNLADGMYRGMDLAHEVQRARAALRSEALPAAPEERQTPLRALSLSGRIDDGALRSDSLSAETDFMRLSGRGAFNLLEQTLDYRLDAQVLRDAAGFGELAGVTLPLTIQGPMMSPRVGVDLTGAVAGAVRERVEDRARDALLRRLGRDEGRDRSPDAGPPPGGESTAEDAAQGSEAAAGERAAEPGPEQQRQKEPSPRDLLRRGLRDLITPGTENQQ